jgi:hypothetical protein
LHSVGECEAVIEENFPASSNSIDSVTETKEAIVPIVDPAFIELVTEVESRATQGLFGMCPRVPEDGLRCAGRKGATRLLWLHEFFVVREGTRTKRTCSVYEALQCLLGVHLPEGSVNNMTDESRRYICVGVPQYLLVVTSAIFLQDIFVIEIVYL